MERKKIRVLLVDADETSAYRLRQMFACRNGVATWSLARSLKEAREKIAGVTPDIVLSDLHLPDGEATELLTTSNGRPGFPLVVLVRRGDERSAAAAVEAGAADFMVKNGTLMADMPRVVSSCLREWKHLHQMDRAEKTIKLLRGQGRDYRRQLNNSPVARDDVRNVDDMLSPVEEYAKKALLKVSTGNDARSDLERIIDMTRRTRERLRDLSSNQRPEPSMSGITKRGPRVESTRIETRHLVTISSC
jgi:chemotaxis response regulator CheB